jgi:pimeloyl-ACP methyl ester carboxylesterase
LKAINQRLYEHDHAVFTFNFSDTHGMDLERQVEDIKDIIDHFATDYEEFILIGGSFGALSITIASKRSTKIKGLITVNGFFGSGKLGRPLLPKYYTFRAMTITSAKARKFWKFYKEQFSPRELRLPVLVIHSMADEQVSIRQSRDFFEQLPGPKEFQTLKTSDHNLMPLTETDDIVRMIDEWLEKI